MVTLWSDHNNHHVWKGLSTDSKPTKHTDENTFGAYNGDEFIEMDTGKVYMFDEANNQWKTPSAS